MGENDQTAVADRPVQTKPATDTTKVDDDASLTTPGNSAIVTQQRAGASADNTGLPSVTVDKPPTLDDPTRQVIAQKLHDALNDKDKDRAERILSTLSEDDRKALTSTYQQKFNNQGPDALLNDIKKLGGSDAEKLIAILNRKDDHTNDAGQLAYELQRLRDGNKDSDKNIREIFSTLRSDQIQQLDADYRAVYGKSYIDAINETPNVSEETKQALKILQKGIDNRTAADDVTLAQMAVQNKDMSLLAIALRGSDNSAMAARLTLQHNPDFVQQLNDAFGKDKRIANDILQQGHISLETIADVNNAGYFGGSNKKNVELALENASPEERRRYAHGRELELRFQSGWQGPLLPEDQSDRDFYVKVHRALENLSTGQSPAPDLYNETKPDIGRYLQDKIGLSTADYERYRTDEGFRKSIDDKAGKLKDADAVLTQDLLKRLKNGENIQELNPLDKLLYDRAMHASPQRIMLDAEALIQSDPQLRDRLKRINSDPTGVPNGDRDQWLQDRIVNGIIKQAIYDGYNKNGLNQGGSADSWIFNLLDKGKWGPWELAELGFPRDIIESRYDGAKKNDVDAANQLIDQREPDRQHTVNDLTKWEDKLIRGGSLISELSDHHKPEEIYSAIEHLSETDYRRGHDPKLNPAFRQDLERALNSFNLDPNVKQRALDLFDSKVGASSYELSQEVHRSVLDVSKDNKNGMIESIYFMSPAEQVRYRTDEAYRKQVDDKVSKELDDAHKFLAQDLLQALKETGKIPRANELNPQDKLFYDSITGASAQQLYKDLEVVLQDKNLRDQLKKDGRLNSSIGLGWNQRDEDPRVFAIAGVMAGTFGRILNEGQSRRPSGAFSVGSDPQPFFARMLQDGKLNLDDKIWMGFPRTDVLSEIAKQPKDKQEDYLYRLQLTDDNQIKFAKSIIERGGNIDLADRLRSFAVGDGTKYGDFKADLQKLDPAALQQLKQDYAKRYGSDLDDDFLRKVDGKEKSNYATLLTPVHSDGRQFYFDALGRLQHSDSGYSPDGTLQTAQRSLQLYAEALQHYQLDGRNLSAADQAQLMQFFEESLQQYKDSKKDFAEKLIQFGEGALFVASGILAIAASGGTLAPEVVLAIGAAAAALDPVARIAVLKAVEGNDFDGSTANILKQIGLGVVDGALNFAPIVGGAAIEISGRAAAAAAAKTAAGVGLDEAAAASLKANLEPVLADAVKQGRARLTEAEVDQILAKSGITGEKAQAARNALLKESQASAEGEVFAYKTREFNDKVRELRANEAPGAPPTGGFGDNGFFGRIKQRLADAWNGVWDRINKFKPEKPNGPEDVIVSINGRDYKLTNGELQIGRDTNSTLGDIPTVSRDQGKLEFKDGKYYFTDNNSTNGTFIKKHGSDQWEQLPKGQRYEVGPYDQLRVGGVNGPSIDIFKADGPIHYEVSLNGQYLYPGPDGRIPVGREFPGLNSGSQDIIDNQVSRNHGFLTKDQRTGQFVFTDTSSNGTYIEHADGSYTLIKDGKVYERAKGSDQFVYAADNNASYLKDTDKIHLGQEHGPELTIGMTRGRTLEDGSYLYRKPEGDVIVRQDGTSLSRSFTGEEVARDAQQKVQQVTHPTGRNIEYQYDQQGRLNSLQVSDGQGNFTAYITTDGGATWTKSTSQRGSNTWVSERFEGKVEVQGDGKLRLTPNDANKPVELQSVDGSIEKVFRNGFHEWTPAALDVERANYRALANHAFGDLAQRNRFLQLSSDFERTAAINGLTREEVAGVYQQIDRLLGAGTNAALSEAERVKLAEQIMFNAANPHTIDQGTNLTCNVATIEGRVFTKSPQDAARLIVDAALSGKTTLPNGVVVDISRVDGLDYYADAVHGWDKSTKSTDVLSKAFDKNFNGRFPPDIKVDGYRNWADQIFQNVAVNTHWANATEYIDDATRQVIKVQPGDRIQYFKDPPSPGNPDGEHLVLYRLENGHLKEYQISTRPNIPTEDLQGVYNQIVPNRLPDGSIAPGSETGFIFAGNKSWIAPKFQNDILAPQTVDEFERLLIQNNGKLPAVVWVDTRNPLFGQSGGGSHVVLVTGYRPDPNNPGHLLVDISNQWGSSQNMTAPAGALYGALWR